MEPTLNSALFASRPKNRPWLRLLARRTDIVWGSTVISYALAFSAPEIFGVISDLTLSILFLPVIFVLDALMLGTLGTTPGKLLYNIKVRHTDGRKLTVPEALKREFKVWWWGLGAGVPFLTLFMSVTSYSTLEKTGRTRWDAEGEYQIEHGKLGVLRVILIILAIAGDVYLQLPARLK